MNAAEIDKIISDLKTALYSESRSRKIKEIDPSFYKNISEAIFALQEEADGYLKNMDITNFMARNSLISTIRNDMKSFLQRRFEKIVSKAIYDIDSDVLSVLTQEEKEFIENIHNIISDEFSVLLSYKKEEEASKASEEPAPVEIETSRDVKPQAEAAAPEETVKAEEKENKGDVLIMVLEDLPPIAQPSRNYVLKKNDLVYVPYDLMEILVKRKSAVVVESPEKDSMSSTA
ncbi:MAG: hypothetical protein ACP5UV_06325 [Thermoplasmata archaeon]